MLKVQFLMNFPQVEMCIRESAVIDSSCANESLKLGVLDKLDISYILFYMMWRPRWRDGQIKPVRIFFNMSSKGHSTVFIHG